MEPSAPPIPAPPDRAADVAPVPAPTNVARPSSAPSQLVSRVAPKLEALSSWVKTHKGELGFALRDLGSGRELSSEGATRSLNPASNEKLITAAVALSAPFIGSQMSIFTTMIFSRVQSGF